MIVAGSSLEVLPVAGLPMRNGSRVLENYVPDVDATVITREEYLGGILKLLEDKRGAIEALNRDELHRVWILRKVLSALSPVEAMELMLDKLARTKGNRDFLDGMAIG